MNERLLNALKGQNFDGSPPIWLMRQAGRYMAEYRALRANHSFLEMCHRPDLIVEVTQLPVNVFDFDAAILFSDILLILESFGVGLRFDEGAGPLIEQPLQTAQDVLNLKAADLSLHLSPVLEAISCLRQELKVPLIGFCGAPFTVASYLIEGRTSRDFKKTKRWMLRDPASFHCLLHKLAVSTIDYLKMQIKAGVQAVQLFDSWASVLAPHQFREFSLRYMSMIVQELQPLQVPIILFCRGSSAFAELLAEAQPAAISLDWNGDIARIRQKLPRSIALQGNLDPDVLYAPLDHVRKEASHMLQSMQGDPAYIFNLGHGIAPDTPVDAVKILVETVKCNAVV